VERQQLELMSLAAHLLHLSLELAGCAGHGEESQPIDISSLRPMLEDLVRDLNVLLDQ